MNSHVTRLIGREPIAEGTMAFHLEKPTGFGFRPGQAVDVALTDPPAGDAQSARHAFSIVSAPFQQQLTFATRMRGSAFKRALRALPIGSPVGLQGPFGSLLLHNNRTRAAVFLAGGIGITPFISILRQAANDQLRQRVLLLYANRRPEDAAFLDELQQMERQNRNFRLVATMNEMGKSNQAWTGETRLIDADLIQGVTADLAAPIFYLAGPPMMVDALRQALGRAGVDDDDIRSEEFYGY
jgi:ferredoxin-NADP reductase